MSCEPEPRERVLSLRPFTLRRRITWGECDAAGVVYTPRYGDIAAETNQVFLAHALGAGGLMAGKQAHGLGTPCKALAMVFHASLRPDELVDLRVRAGRLGRTSFELLTTGTTPAGQPVFEVRTTLIAVAPGTRDAIPVPDTVRAALQAHVD